MNCMGCDKDFKENEIHESHDVPCYLFPGANRKERKQHADKFGRRDLCKKCHDEYELKIIKILYLNLYRKEIEYEENLSPYMKKIWRLCESDEKKRELAIKICKKINVEKK